jgi:hypothetical protein
MCLYEGSLSDFNRDVPQNKAADAISASCERYYRRRVKPTLAWERAGYQRITAIEPPHRDVNMSPDDAD